MYICEGNVGKAPPLTLSVCGPFSITGVGPVQKQTNRLCQARLISLRYRVAMVCAMARAKSGPVCDYVYVHTKKIER